MATAGDGRAPSESGGAGEKSRKTPVRTENPAGRSSDEGGNSGTSEVEQMLKQVAVTRFEIQHPATIEDLPDEILVNIFIRLFARQLAQMRSVSKSWNAIISDPSFVKSHLHHSIRNNNHQLLLLFPNYYDPFTQYSSKSLHLEPTNFINHIPNNLPMNRVIGSVNGLICLSSENSYSDIHIWNPSLSAVSTIPPPHSIMPSFSYLNNIRFGYDPKTDDYKLVNISGICDNDFVSVKEWLQVEVYSVRKGCWEFITQPIPSHIRYISNPDYVCVDGHQGHLHWKIETVVEEEAILAFEIEETILAFDLGSETFCEIPLPDSILDSNHKKYHLGVLDGKLCEISWRKDGGWEVWVMEEYGVPESWVRCHVLPQFKVKGDRTFPYGFTSRNGRFSFGFTSRSEFLLQDKYGRLVLYDPIADKTKSTRAKQRVLKIVEYVDSLVWI